MARSTEKRAAVFLDRDNTLMVDVPYCRQPEDVRLFPGSAEAVRRFRELGFLVVLITNQSGIARGLFTEADLKNVNGEVERQLSAEGGHLDAVYHCPHLPSAGCACRKPGILLFQEACSDLVIDPAQSYVVGDRGADIEAAIRIRSTPVLIRNKVGTAEVEASGLRPALVCSNLLEFATFLSKRAAKDSRNG